MTTSRHDRISDRFTGDGLPLVVAGYDEDVQDTLFDNRPDDIEETPDDVASDAPKSEKESQKIPPEIERVRQLLDTTGFVPSSRRELTLARSIVKKLAAGEDYAAFLSSVRGKQKQAGVLDTDRALHIIDEEVRDFSRISGGDVSQLGLVLGSLDMSKGPVDMHPQASASTQPEIAELDGKRGVKRAISLVVRRARIDEALAAEDTNGQEVNLDDGVTDDEIMNYLNTHTVREARDALLTERNAQRRRHAFWEMRLREGREYALAPKVAVSALDERAW